MLKVEVNILNYLLDLIFRDKEINNVKMNASVDRDDELRVKKMCAQTGVTIPVIPYKILKISHEKFYKFKRL